MNSWIQNKKVRNLQEKCFKFKENEAIDLQESSYRFSQIKLCIQEDES